ncbi:MAG TPA: PadR family transcriptional regulator [Miltoncostaeales bacterium]|nr:PadR family transcriptional regulator [Miltoncostaeales bacterium]
MSVREGLLALLAAGPRHGYQLKSEFEARTAGVWTLNIGQVYSTLERLERDGLVEAAGEADTDGRRVYTITGSGQDELDRYLNLPSADETPSRDGLMLKVLVAIGTPGINPLTVVGTERAARMATLQSRRRELRDANVNGDLAKRLAFDALIAITESELRWLDICEERLMHHPTDHTTTNSTPKEHA